LVDQLLAIIPSNPVGALATGNTLQIVAFALIFGVSMVSANDRAQPVANFFDSFSAVMERLIGLVMATAPYGVFALIATTVGTQGLSILGPLGRVIAAVGIACGIHMMIVYSSVLVVWARFNPIRFFARIGPVAMMAFTTTSVGATLPVSLETTQRKLGVSETIAKFVLPIGATVNKGGTVIYQSVAVVFIAQAYGVPLSLANYAMIGLITLISSFGTPSIPGAGLIILTLILTSAGLPVEGVAVIAGIDRVLDMIRTPTNVIGDCVVAVVVAESEGELARQE